jgi:hypothetical protein
LVSFQQIALLATVRGYLLLLCITHPDYLIWQFRVVVFRQKGNIITAVASAKGCTKAAAVISYLHPFLAGSDTVKYMAYCGMRMCDAHNVVDEWR